MCKNSQDSGNIHNSGSSGCETNGSYEHGIVAVYNGTANAPTWPKEKKSSGKDGEGPKAVAENIVALTDKDKKIKIAEHLTKSIEGGEVVEIRSVSSTSVMVNACYDLLSEGI
ncbi:P44/Msp2 family outer membrane protein, partial [Candidatus Anaplasma sp. TIGMIC]|uniref:P44/Msp2 family outer membrane protein n=1 Tax=Candidatus Anaplasma sp. TIGMIC TaxID=3020713 RepID=UPI00232F6666